MKKWFRKLFPKWVYDERYFRHTSNRFQVYEGYGIDCSFNDCNKKEYIIRLANYKKKLEIENKKEFEDYKKALKYLKRLK